MKDHATPQRLAWLNRLQHRRKRLVDQMRMATPIHLPHTERTQRVLRGMPWRAA